MLAFLPARVDVAGVLDGHFGVGGMQGTRVLVPQTLPAPDKTSQRGHSCCVELMRRGLWRWLFRLLLLRIGIGSFTHPGAVFVGLHAGRETLLVAWAIPLDDVVEFFPLISPKS